MEIKKILKNILFVLSFFVVLTALYLTHIMSDFLLPIIFGFFVAFMFQPILRKFEQTKIPRWLSTIIVIVIALILLSFFVFIITISIQKFANDLPLYMKDLQKKLLLFIDKLFTLDIIKNYVDKTRLNILITDLITRINFGAYMSSTMAKTLDIIRSFLLFVFALIFIIPGISRLDSRIIKAFPEKSKIIGELINNITVQFQNYIFVKFLISFITGVLVFIVCLLFKLKYSLLWGFIAFMFNFIPYLGSIISVFLPFSFSLLQFQSFPYSIAILVILTVIQNILGNFLEPKFQSQGVNLSPIIIFTSVMIWGFIWGVAGVFLAIPIMAAFNIICENVDGLKPISVLISSKKKEKEKK